MPPATRAVSLATLWHADGRQREYKKALLCARDGDLTLGHGHVQAR